MAERPPVGAAVRLHSLTRAELNGLCGIVCREAGERLGVRLAGRPEPIAIRPVNLELIGKDEARAAARAARQQALEESRASCYGEKFREWCPRTCEIPESAYLPLVGIPNVGTTCYLNVLLQAFATCPWLVWMLEAAAAQSDAYRQACDSQQKCVLHMLRQHFAERRAV